jgi:hypothetical protein
LGTRQDLAALGWAAMGAGLGWALGWSVRRAGRWVLGWALLGAELGWVRDGLGDGAVWARRWSERLVALGRAGMG